MSLRDTTVLVLAVIAVFVAALLVGTAVSFLIYGPPDPADAASANLPERPAEAALMRPAAPVAQCGSNYGVYSIVYDLNPATQAAYIEAGAYEVRNGEDVYLGPPVAVVIANDAGMVTAYVKDPSGVREYTAEAFEAKYADLCTLPGIVPRREAQG